MKKLKKYELDFDITWKYIKNNIEGANTLCTELINILDFHTGFFFTLLPSNANFQRINEFTDGIILPQNPNVEFIINEKKASYSEIPTLQEELCDFIFKTLNDNQKLSCIFDDVLRSSDSSQLDFFNQRNLFFTYNEELYYKINKNNVNYNSILKCIEMSNAIWHSLCIISENQLNSAETILTLEKIKAICMNAKIVIIGAYDGEGYIFWEKASY